MIRTNRGIIRYILLTIITCGVYAFWYQHKLAKDINTICEGDGKKTGGLLKLVFFGIITFGVYIFVWYFGVENRLIANAERYGVKLSVDGKAIVLWKLFGVFLFGVGPLVAEYIIMNNTNMLADAYNKHQAGMKQQESVTKCQQKLEGECKWYISLIAILALVSTQINFGPSIWGMDFGGLYIFYAIVSEWETNAGLCILGCLIMVFFYLGVMLYVLSAVLLFLRHKREIGTTAVIAFYCNLITAIGFFVLETKLFEHISSFYLTLF